MLHLQLVTFPWDWTDNSAFGSAFSSVLASRTAAPTTSSPYGCIHYCRDLQQRYKHVKGDCGKLPWRQACLGQLPRHKLGVTRCRYSGDKHMGFNLNTTWDYQHLLHKSQRKHNSRRLFTKIHPRGSRCALHLTWGSSRHNCFLTNYMAAWPATGRATAAPWVVSAWAAATKKHFSKLVIYITIKRGQDVQDKL